MSTTTRLFRPFPWGSLDSTTTQQAMILQDARRWAAAHVRLGSIEAAASRLLETEVGVVVRRAGFFRADRPFGDGVGVLLAADEGVAPGPCVLVVAERALAAAVVARALRRAALPMADPAAALAPALGGAFSAAVAALARRAHSETPLRVARVGPPAALEADLAGEEPILLQATLTIVIEQDAFSARVVLSRDACRAPPAPPFSARVLRDLGPAPLALPVVACASRAKAADVEALRPGDAFMPERWPLSRSAGGALLGPAWLAAPDADTGIRVEIGEGGRLVLRGGVDPLCLTEDAVDEPTENSALVSAVGDVPVVVKVEIGEACMPARQWASLACGDVVALGRRLGETVVLRIGGIAIARGELVDIDGEIGVRIAERLGGERTAP